MSVEVGSIGCVSGGGGECKHEVRDYTCPGVQNPKLCNEEGMVGEGGDSNGVGDEPGNDVVCGQCRGAFQSVQSSVYLLFLLECPHPQSTGTTKLQCPVGTRKRPKKKP